MEKEFKFKIVVPSFNSVDYIGKTLESIEMQTDINYDVCVVDDGSTIPRQRDIITDFCRRNGWLHLFNEKNHGPLYSLVNGINQFAPSKFKCNDHDVIVVLDGDDWFAHKDVLAHIRKIYTENDVYITWGQCEIYPGGKTPMNYAQPVPEMVIKQKLYRDIPFVFWIGTFKYYLWRNIEDKDLRDVDGEYFKLMKDKATLFPMLEMAGERIYFINETTYIYNLNNPLNEYKGTRPEEHVRVDEEIRKRRRYSTLPPLKND
ncbi:MAG: glycosyltransferase family 2 protein [Parachlamydiaceae bacterium]